MTTGVPARQEGDVTSSGGEGELADKVRAGDREAWEALYRRAYPRLYAYAARRLPSPDAARDAVGEALLRAVAGIGNYRGAGAGLDAWLYGILRHVVLDAQRRGARQSGQPVPDRPSEERSAADDIVRREEAAHVRAAFARLTPDDQEILELRVVGGLRADEVAQVLGRRPGAVRMAQNRALHRLRAQLEREDRHGA